MHTALGETSWVRPLRLGPWRLGRSRPFVRRRAGPVVAKLLERLAAQEAAREARPRGTPAAAPVTGVTQSRPRSAQVPQPSLPAQQLRTVDEGDQQSRETWPQHYELSGVDFNVPTNFTKHYLTGKHIGAGAYGVVNLIIERQSGQEYAVKLLPKTRGKLSKEKTLRKVRREIELLARVQDCRSVVHLHGVYESDSHIYIVMELCTGGDLERILEEHGPFTERQTATVLYECLKVVAACHATGITHGDVKPANFMMRQRFKDPVAAIDSRLLRGAWLKAVDFGCSQGMTPGRALTRRTGTPVYMAPEVFKREYGQESDMWSLGMMMYQLLTGRFPFWPTLEECRAQSIDAVMAAVITQDIPINFGPWLRMSSEGKAFLQRLLLRNPAARISAAEAMEHPWFKRQLAPRAEGAARQQPEAKAPVPVAAGMPAAAAAAEQAPPTERRRRRGPALESNNIVPISPRTSGLTASPREPVLVH